jgi:alkyl hydroperoxide reductase subunit F
MYDLIVIGGGPAGLTAAIYAIRRRLNILLISKDLGGKTNYHLELPDLKSYRVITGTEVVDKFKSELEYLKFARHMEPVVKVEKNDDHFIVHTKGGGELMARSVIVATGAQQQWLDVPGEREYLSKGLCYSALSYAPLFIDRDTVVIGNGDLALRSAAELSTVARHVHVVGTSHEALQTPLGQMLDKAENVTVLKEYRVTEVAGNGYCNSVSVQGPEGQKMELKADGTFVEKALRANVSMVADLVELDELGFIKVDAYSRTNVP